MADEALATFFEKCYYKGVREMDGGGVAPDRSSESFWGFLYFVKNKSISYLCYYR